MTDKQIDGTEVGSKGEGGRTGCVERNYAARWGGHNQDDRCEEIECREGREQGRRDGRLCMERGWQQVVPAWRPRDKWPDGPEWTQGRGPMELVMIYGTGKRISANRVFASGRLHRRHGETKRHDERLVASMNCNAINGTIANWSR